MKKTNLLSVGIACRLFFSPELVESWFRARAFSKHEVMIEEVQNIDFAVASGLPDEKYPMHLSEPKKIFFPTNPQFRSSKTNRIICPPGKFFFRT